MINYSNDMTKSQIEAGKWLECSELTQGDKIKLTNGDIAEFVRLKQKNFIGIVNGKSYNVPVTMFISVVEKANNNQKQEEYKTLKSGELFFIDDNKGNAMLFIFDSVRNNKIIGINPITKGSTRIDVKLYRGKVSDIK